MKFSPLLVLCLAGQVLARDTVGNANARTNTNTRLGDGGSKKSGSKRGTEPRGLYPATTNCKKAKKTKKTESTTVEVAVGCGDEITSDAMLSDNLVCDDASALIDTASGGAALVVNGATLDCAGKSIINTGSAWVGIQLKNGGKVLNCVIAGFGFVGIQIPPSDTANNNVENTLLYDNVFGMYIAGTGDNQLTNVKAMYNANVGFSFNNLSGSISLSGVSAIGSSLGIASDGGGDLTITDSEFADNTSGGIQTSSSGSIMVRDTKIVNNGGIGLYIYNPNPNPGTVGGLCEACLFVGNAGSGVFYSVGTGAEEFKVINSSFYLNGGGAIVNSNDSDEFEASGLSCSGNTGTECPVDSMTDCADDEA